MHQQYTLSYPTNPCNNYTFGIDSVSLQGPPYSSFPTRSQNVESLIISQWTLSNCILTSVICKLCLTLSPLHFVFLPFPWTRAPTLILCCQLLIPLLSLYAPCSLPNVHTTRCVDAEPSGWCWAQACCSVGPQGHTNLEPDRDIHMQIFM